MHRIWNWYLSRQIFHQLGQDLFRLLVLPDQKEQQERCLAVLQALPDMVAVGYQLLKKATDRVLCRQVLVVHYKHYQQATFYIICFQG